MAIRRSATTSFRRRKRAVRKTAFVRQPRNLMRPRRAKVYNFTRNLDGTTVSGISASTIVQAAAGSHRACAFTLADVPNATEFTALFDMYRIKCIVIKLIPMIRDVSIDSATVPPTLGQGPGLVFHVIDNDDANALTAIADYYQYQNFRHTVVASPKSVIRKIYPKVIVPAFQGSTFSSPTPVGNRWIDCSAPTAWHYGFKFYIPPYQNAATPQIWQVQLKYYLQFKNVR